MPLPPHPTMCCPGPGSELATSIAAASPVEPALLLSPAPAPLSLPGPRMAPHRTDPSLQAAARNFQGVDSCSLLVPGTTERDMYLQQTQDAHQCLSDACGPREVGGPAEQPKPRAGHNSKHLEEAQRKTEPFPNPRGALRPSDWAQDTRDVCMKPH